MLGTSRSNGGVSVALQVPLRRASAERKTMEMRLNLRRISSIKGWGEKMLFVLKCAIVIPNHKGSRETGPFYINEHQGRDTV